MGSEGVQDRSERQRQRYDNYFRLVAGCIPYKLKPHSKEQGHDLSKSLEVLMVTSPNRQDLVFPKGGWENDETEVEAATREALEEAGVKGVIQGTLGVWEFKSKSSQNSIGLKGSCRGTMYALEVTEELPLWPEKEIHDRRWVNVQESWELCRYSWMREALCRLLQFLYEQAALSAPEMPDFMTSSTFSSMSRTSAKIIADIPETLKPYMFNPMSGNVSTIPTMLSVDGST